MAAYDSRRGVLNVWPAAYSGWADCTPLAKKEKPFISKIFLILLSNYIGGWC